MGVNLVACGRDQYVAVAELAGGFVPDPVLLLFEALCVVDESSSVLIPKSC